MPTAFVIRPFEVKKDSSGREIDFERIHERLIRPALQQRGYGGPGHTTGEIVEAGNIRKDMFLLILEADLVICDITMHNANVFYELGIRHALRQKHTVLIRGEPTTDTTPFDLLTDRYLKYQLDSPEKSITELVNAIEKSEKSARQQDSPIFGFLENLPETALTAVREPHPHFIKEVEKAKTAKAKGWLRLLAEEVCGLKFRRKGLRVVARAQWELRDHEGARDTWERILEDDQGDVEANLILSEVFGQGFATTSDGALRELSERAVARVLDGGRASNRERARALTRRGHNLKALWRSELEREAPDEKRQEAAASRLTVEAFRTYWSAFLEDPADVRSGLAAFQMGSILLDLSAEPTSTDAFDDDKEAEDFKSSLPTEVDILRRLVTSLLRSELSGQQKVAAETARAELLLLGKQSKGRVVKAFQNAIPPHVPEVHWRWARRELELYAELGIQDEVATEVIAKMDDRFPESRETDAPHIVLVSGLRVSDGWSQEEDERARELLEDSLRKKLEKTPVLEGFAAAAPGVEIIFHEICSRLGIRSTICLPMPAAKYAAKTFGELDGWRTRFLELTRPGNAVTTVFELGESEDPPDWLYEAEVDVWERASQWMLKLAQARTEGDLTLFVLRSEGSEQDMDSLERLARESGTVRIEPLRSDA